MGWCLPNNNQWPCICRLWCRLVNMSTNRLCKRVFLWARDLANNNRKTWYFYILNMFRSLECQQYGNVDTYLVTSQVVSNVKSQLSVKNNEKWLNSINKDNAVRGNGRNKLRTYKMLKFIYETEIYVKKCLPRQHRSALTKFRGGVAPINLEIGRYNGTPENETVCINCTNSIENELHVLLHCPLYNHIRHFLFLECIKVNFNFANMSDIEKLCFILSNSSICKYSAKACHEIIVHQRTFVYL